MSGRNLRLEVLFAMKNPRSAVLVLLALVSTLFLSSPLAAQEPPAKGKSAKAAAAPAAEGTKPGEAKKDEPFKGMAWRQVGPFRGGRALAVAGVPGDANTFYFGAVAGGVWKTTDGGLTWAPISDKSGIESVGSIAVADSDPNIIYVGTGEACIRGNIVRGDGVYKSTDAGKSWKFLGLKDTQTIGKVIVNPKNPDVVFVAAMGHVYGPNTERGVFRSTDGGKSWEKVLYKDEKTGAIDITFDPTNASILYAALWEAYRTPWSMSSGGPGSGLYKSTDGGSTWKKIEGEGLPKGVWGRIGVAVAPNSNRVWAQIEAKEGGLYRSDDAGATWHLMNEDHRTKQRAWYFSHVVADPQNPDVVYFLNVGMFRSSDGGKTLTPMQQGHGDNHGLWIDATNPKRMISGSDGGAAVSANGGESWTTLLNQPTAQFYHVATDNRYPYYLYGAQQDNSSVAIASATDHFVIDRPDWYAVSGCESGYIVPDPRDFNIVYGGCYGGHIERLDKRTGEQQEINAWPVEPIGWGAADLKYRFQWTAPIAISPLDPGTVYHGAQVVFKSTDGGMSWTAISPDLTRNDKSKQASSGGPITQDNTSVEYYDTVFSIEPSPLEKDTIWVGTDDGLVQLTRDGGKTWANITPKEMPEWSRIALVAASPFDASTAYVAADRHELDDFAPYIYKTADFGKSWTRIDNGLPAGASVHAVREDTVRKGLLFAGTETGIWVSFDDGAHWQSLQQNLPPTPVHDLVVKGDDIAVATHGRSFWVLDDISPLRQYGADVTSGDAYFFKPATALRTDIGSGGAPRGAAPTAGQNRPNGAVFYYWLKTTIKPPEKPAEGEGKEGEARPEGRRPAPPVTLEILDAQGKLVRKYPAPPPAGEEEGGRRARPRNLPTEAGVNRFVWDLHYAEATTVPGAVLWGGDMEGPVVVPGSYTAKLTVEGKAYTQPFEVKLDPRVTTSQADLEKQLDLARKVHQRLDEMNRGINQIRDVRRQVQELTKRLDGDPRGKEIRDAAKQLDAKLTAVEDVLIQSKSKSNEDPLNYPVKLNNTMAELVGVIESAPTAPTQQSYDVFNMLSAQLDEQLAKWKGILETDVPAFNDLVKKQEIPAVLLPTEKGGHRP
jgi:photosystem II stability/assembly factor-like uncharacterized protein